MNNAKKNVLLMAAISVLLVMGTTITPMQSYADRDNDNHKKTKDFQSKIIASSESDKKSASQHQDQDNFCYRGDDCDQANQGQQVIGKDNDAKGFNDQSDNIELAAIDVGAGNGNGNGNGTGNGGNAQECALCLANVNLTDFFNNTIVITAGIDNVTELCAALANGTLSSEILALLVTFLNRVTINKHF